MLARSKMEVYPRLQLDRPCSGFRLRLCASVWQWRLSRWCTQSVLYLGRRLFGWPAPAVQRRRSTISMLRLERQHLHSKWSDGCWWKLADVVRSIAILWWIPSIEIIDPRISSRRRCRVSRWSKFFRFCPWFHRKSVCTERTVWIKSLQKNISFIRFGRVVAD